MVMRLTGPETARPLDDLPGVTWMAADRDELSVINELQSAHIADSARAIMPLNASWTTRRTPCSGSMLASGVHLRCGWGMLQWADVLDRQPTHIRRTSLQHRCPNGGPGAKEMASTSR